MNESETRGAGEAVRVAKFDHDLAMQRDVVGGKGASLGRLARGGFPVPPGFSVTVDAHGAFIEAAAGAVSEKVAALDFSDAAQLEAKTAEIRELIVSEEMPAGLAEEITSAYRALGGDEVVVAVRSSGTSEDSADTSFAGLYDTYLEIVGADAVLDAVKRCWASMWTGRAAAYRNDQGQSQADIRMAVVVQQMVSSEVSGVLFTANPVNGRTDEIVVNASWGLGESVVSGIVTPDEYIFARKRVDSTPVISRRNPELKRRTLGSKEVQIVRHPDGSGTTEQPVPDAMQNAYSLSDERVTELAELAERVMAYYDGLPQDIEWGYAAGDFYLLQVRPVTGIELTWEEDVTDSYAYAEHDEETVWTSQWSEDFLTGGISPLYHSSRPHHFQKCQNYTKTIYGLEELYAMRLYKYHRATAYFNSTFELRWNIVTLPPDLRLPDFVPPSWEGELRGAPFSLGKFLKIWTRMHLLEPSYGFNLREGTRGWFDSLYDMIDNRTEESRGPSQEELRKFSEYELDCEIARSKGVLDEMFINMWPGYNFYAPAIFNALALLLGSWYDGDNPSVFQELCSGIPETNMMWESKDQYALAEELRKRPEVLERFWQADGTEFFTELETYEEGRRFLEKYQQFLRDHGHRGHQDRDVAHKRRIEDPNLDLRMLRAVLQANEDSNPAALEERFMVRREEALEDVLQNIRRKPLGTLKAVVFERLYYYVLRFLKQRDDERHWLDMIEYAGKKPFVELGRRMEEEGLLEDRNDVFFLTEKELRELRSGWASPPLCRAKVPARREVWNRRNRREEPTPMYLEGGDVLDERARTEVEAEEDGILRGMGTSAGQVTATARIAPNLGDIGRVKPGEVLITYSTDPGWNPVFGVISGIVVETGGMLAHAACLSREYGLPSVLLRGAMQKIPDGATVTVDGQAGSVTVHEDGAEMEDAVSDNGEAG